MHCHPGTFLLSRHSRTFEIHPNHQSESSRVGKGNGCPWALFPRESVFCQMLRRCSTGLCSCCLWVPFSTAEGTEWLLALILLNLIGSRTGWSLIFWSLQLMSACVCVCVHAYVCTFAVGLLCSLPWISVAAAWPHLCPRLQWNHLLLLSVQRWLRSLSTTFLPPVTWCRGGHRASSRSQSILALLVELLNKSCVHCFWGCWFSTI